MGRLKAVATRAWNKYARTSADYAQRMQIAETIRDLKSPRFGFALRYARTKCPERLATLLLIAALATLIL